MAAVEIRIRRDTEANWLLANPVLASGEPTVAWKPDGTSYMRVGDGVRAWAELPDSQVKKGDKGDKGDTGDVTPAAIAAREAAIVARNQAETFSATAVTLQDSAVASLILGTSGAESKEALGSVFASRAGGLTPTKLTGVSIVSNDTGVQPFKQLGSETWGRIGTAFHVSMDGGRTWTPRGSAPSPSSPITMEKTATGEVILLTDSAIYLSTGWPSGAPTWELKASTNGASQFHGWSLAGDGTKFITTEYAAGASFPDSRYARRTLDGGKTWDVCYDSVARHGQAAAALSHLHGCAYDKATDRFYISEGHSAGGDIGGIYSSSDNGNTWVRAEGMKSDPAPTVIIPTDNGLFCASDNPEGGTYGVPRVSDPLLEKLSRTWAWRPGYAGTVGFGVSGMRDPSTGIVYVGYRTEKAEVAPIIIAGTATSGNVVFEWPTLPVTAYSDIRSVLVTAPGEILAVASTDGHTKKHLVRGVAPSPGAPAAVDSGGILGGYTGSGVSLSVGPLSSTGTSMRSVAVGVNSVVESAQGVTAVGYGTRSGVGASDSTVIGSEASTVGAPSSVAVGKSASAKGAFSVAIGHSTEAAAGSIAIGRGTKSTAGSVSIGENSGNSVGSGGVIVGNSAKSANGGTAIGNGSAHSGNNAVTVGGLSKATGDGTAIGTGADAAGINSVAIGRGTTTTRPNEVSLGDRFLGLGLMGSDPGAPTVSGVYLFAKVGVSGKPGLYARFPSGASVGPIIEQP